MCFHNTVILACPTSEVMTFLYKPVKSYDNGIVLTQSFQIILRNYIIFKLIVMTKNIYFCTQHCKPNIKLTQNKTAHITFWHLKAWQATFLLIICKLLFFPGPICVKCHIHVCCSALSVMSCTECISFQEIKFWNTLSLYLFRQPLSLHL